jgi:hypothetical protein
MEIPRPPWKNIAYRAPAIGFRTVDPMRKFTYNFRMSHSGPPESRELISKDGGFLARLRHQRPPELNRSAQIDSDGVIAFDGKLPIAGE